MAYKQGQSGNLNGRPKRRNTAAEKARLHVDKAISVLVEQLDCDDNNIRHKAAVSLLDRGFGKPQEFVELSGDDDNPITTRQLPATDSLITRLLGARAQTSHEVSSEE